MTTESLERAARDILRRGLDPARALHELRRELRVRLRVFPRWVEEEKLKSVQAEHRTAKLMLAIHLLEGLIPEQGGLFDPDEEEDP